MFRLLLQRPPTAALALARTTGLRFSSTLPRSCPSCGAPLPTALPLCPKCSFIAVPAPQVSYHELLNLPDSPNAYIIDEKLLKRRFLEAQRLCHPDAWSGKEQQKQDISSALSTHVNNAYQTLLSPYKRALYVLERQGLTVGESDQVDDPELLMEVLELREEIENASEEDGGAERVAEIGQQMKGTIQETAKQIEALVADGDWDGVKEATVRLRYWQSIADAAKRWPSLEPDHHD